MKNNNENNIHVEHGKNEVWHVTRGGQLTPVGSYGSRRTAMAFARAIAFDRNVEMIVHDIDGSVTRHQRASLTYPISLE